MKKHEPYIFEEGQIIAYKYRGFNEYAKTGLSRDGSRARTILAGGYNGEERMLHWAKLGGRSIVEVACSNPIPLSTAPTEILHIVNLGKPTAAIKLREKFPKKYADVWETYTQDELDTHIRSYVKTWVHDVLHGGEIINEWLEKKISDMRGYADFLKQKFESPKTQARLDAYVKIVMETPFGGDYWGKVKALNL